MQSDPRCCGSGTCIIDDSGRCWCGQQWNGHEMCAPALPATLGATPAAGDGGRHLHPATTSAQADAA